MLRFNPHCALLDSILLLYFMTSSLPLPAYSTYLGPNLIDQHCNTSSCNKTSQHDTSLNKNDVNNLLRPPRIVDGDSVRVNSVRATTVSVHNPGKHWIVPGELNVTSRKLQVSGGEGANSANYSDILRIRTKKLAATKKSFSLVLVNPFKVNEVFEKERSWQSESVTQNSKGRIVLLGLFELSTRAGVRPEGLSELAAAQMAVQHINQQKLLPGYTLELVTNDTEVSLPGIIYSE